VSNGRSRSSGYGLSEISPWVLSTASYVKAFMGQDASEVKAIAGTFIIVLKVSLLNLFR